MATPIPVATAAAACFTTSSCVIVLRFHSQPVGLVQSAYVACLMRGDDTRLASHQHQRTAKCSSATGNAHVRISGHSQEHLCFFFPRSCLVVHATWSVIASEKDKN